MSRHAITIGAVALSLSANASLAQTEGTYLITFDGVVTPQTPSMTVSIWATWADPQQEYLFGGTNYDLEASEGEFVGGTLMLGQQPPNMMGLPAGRKVTGTAIGQVYLPSFGIPDPSNPILLAKYEWTTTNFTPRTIYFETSQTWNFFLVKQSNGAGTQLFPGEFTPGTATYFVPGPPTLMLLACGCLVAARRRRDRRSSNV